MDKYMSTSQALRKLFINPLRLTMYLFSGMLILVLVSACQSETQTVFNIATDNPARLNTQVSNTLVSNESNAVDVISGAINLKQPVNPEGDPFYHALLAEIQLQLGESSLAADEYLLASKTSTDKILLKKATVLAATTGKNQQALEVAKRWVKLETDSLEAKQYQALLLLRTDHYADSAEMLHEIERFVTHESGNPAEAGQFISQLMLLETHHHQAYKTYRVYLNEYGETKENKQITHKNNPPLNLYAHQKVTLARLAVKSKRYKMVLKILQKIQTEQAILLRSKAFNELGQAHQAVAILKPWLDKKTTGDGLRFEYVRYSILSGEKAEATRVLQKLVKKHPDNKDLLKSLVALHLDQKKWDLAETSAKKLMTFKDYRSDANLFMGEIFEARGEHRQALQAYKNVIDGKLVEKALERIPLLIEKQQGISAARLWLHKQRNMNEQKRGEKTREKTQAVMKKAVSYKIEGDLLFANNAYDSALDYYQRALALAPKNPAIRFSRALTYEQQGRIKLAENDFKQVLTLNRQDPAALNALGYLLVVHTGRFDEAMQYIKKAQKLSPDDAAINDSLGWLHYRRGEIKTAERYLRKSFKALKQPDVASHLIEVLQKRGLKQEAKTILYQMLRQYPDNKKLKDISIN
jgi:tetratricopeptide (TPR) repeat protein